MTFDTAFKHLYAKELAPYGFQKLKGRRPYFVRMVGDEIAHVISYRNSWSMRPYKNFIVLWGIATVYRRRINFEKNPRDTTSWTRYVCSPSCKPIFEYRDESMIKPGILLETGGNDVDMMEELEHSVEVVKEEILPRLDQVRTLYDCMEIQLFNSNLFCRGDFDEEDEDSEGMLNFIVYDLEGYEEYCRKSVEQIDTRYKEEHRKIMEERAAIFRKYTQDETYHQKVMEELERRKIANQAILRGYGLEF